MLKAIWQGVIRYLKNLVYVLDLVLNTIFLGDPDETISSRIGKKVDRDKCWLCKVLCKFLDVIDDRHCAKAIKKWEGRGSGDDDSVIQRG